jgi:hypothetical protein
MVLVDCHVMLVGVSPACSQEILTHTCMSFVQTYSVYLGIKSTSTRSKRPLQPVFRGLLLHWVKACSQASRLVWVYRRVVGDWEPGK